jgi:hypothetical protein
MRSPTYKLQHVTAEELKRQYDLRNMQSVYWADYLGEKDGKVYLLRKRAPLIGENWKEKILLTEIARLDPAFLQILRGQEKKAEQKNGDSR